jgi:hypothetical protein
VEQEERGAPLKLIVDAPTTIGWSTAPANDAPSQYRTYALVWLANRGFTMASLEKIPWAPPSYPLCDRVVWVWRRAGGREERREGGRERGVSQKERTSGAEVGVRPRELAKNKKKRKKRG